MRYRPTLTTGLLMLSLACATAAKVRLDQAQDAPRSVQVHATQPTLRAMKPTPATRKPPQPPPQPQPQTIRALVTACSPEDSVRDAEYYRTNGYRGRKTSAVAASHPSLPRGTLVRVPGYAGGGMVRVDAPGGPIIRRARCRGVVQIDVKFRTRAEVMRWGSRWLEIEVIS